jgi:YD repeat-containing protein
MGWRFDRGEIRSCTGESGDSGRSTPIVLLVPFLAILLLLAPRAEAASAERYDYDDLDRLIRAVDEQGQVTEYIYDAVGNLLEVRTGVAGAPVIVSVAPDTIRRGESRRIDVTGSNLHGVQVTADPGLQISNLRTASTEVSFTLTVSLTAELGTRQLVFSTVTGAATANFQIRPELTVTTIPAPMVLPPDNIERPVTLRFSDTNPFDVTFSVSVANPIVARATPLAIVVPAGQIEAFVNIAGLQNGRTALRLASPELGSVVQAEILVSSQLDQATAVFAGPIGVVLNKPQTIGQIPTTVVVGVVKGDVTQPSQPHLVGPVPSQIVGVVVDKPATIGQIPAPLVGVEK